MSKLLFSSLTFLCCINVIWTDTDCPVNCNEKAYVVSNSPTLWFEAHILCQQGEMEMATIESPEEEERLEIELNKLPNLRKGIGKGYWTSGVRRKTSPEMVWFVNGRPLVYNKFAIGQPDDTGNNEKCVEVFVNQQNRILWNDYECDRKIGYVCQKYDRNLECEAFSKVICDNNQKLGGEGLINIRRQEIPTNNSKSLT